MSGMAISGQAASQLQQLQATIATKVRQPNATAQAAAVKTVSATADQMAATLASVSSGLNIQA
jgi:hypothetical protein